MHMQFTIERYSYTVDSRYIHLATDAHRQNYHIFISWKWVTLIALSLCRRCITVPVGFIIGASIRTTLLEIDVDEEVCKENKVRKIHSKGDKYVFGLPVTFPSVHCWTESTLYLKLDSWVLTRYYLYHQIFFRMNRAQKCQLTFDSKRVYIDRYSDNHLSDL